MPPPMKKQVKTEQIDRVLLTGHGWIKIEPGSFMVAPLEFWYPPLAEGQERIFSGLSFLGFTFKEFGTGKTFSTTTDSISACEMTGGE